MFSHDLLSVPMARRLADYTCPMLLAPGLRGPDAATVIHELSYLLSQINLSASVEDAA
jgi:hypothetical protein